MDAQKQEVRGERHPLGREVPSADEAQERVDVAGDIVPRIGLALGRRRPSVEQACPGEGHRVLRRAESRGDRLAVVGLEAVGLLVEGKELFCICGRFRLAGQEEPGSRPLPGVAAKGALDEGAAPQREAPLAKLLVGNTRVAGDLRELRDVPRDQLAQRQVARRP